MKTKLMKVMLILSAVVMLFAVLTVVASAESITVNSVELGDPVVLNVAYTEKEIYQAIGNQYYLASDEAGYSVDPANSYLAYYVAGTGNMNGASASEALSTEKDYYVGITLTLKSGYDWPAAIKTNDAPDFTGFTVTVDGVEIDLGADVAQYYYNSHWNTVLFFVSAGEVGTEGIVTDVTVDPAVASVVKGDSFTFSAVVEGTVDVKTVTWAIEGNNSYDTEIDENGKLTVAEDETANTITVMAISTVDDTKIGEAVVTVLAEEATIILSGMPDSISLYPNDVSSLGVYVTGTETNRELEWTLTGNGDANTGITVYDMYESGVGEWFQNCQVNIGNGETAETITVTVRSVAHPDVVMTTVVTVKTATIVTDIELTLDTDAAALDTTKTEDEMQTIIEENLSVAEGGAYISNVYLLQFSSLGAWNGIGYGTDPVDLEKTYGIEVVLELNSGYAWPSAILEEDYSDLTVTLNGVEIEATEFYYNSYWKSVSFVITPPLVDVEFTGASLALGTDLSLNYSVKIYDAEAVNTAKLAVKFTFNGDEYLVKSYTVDGDTYVFTFPGIAPQQMVDTIGAQLVILGDGNAVEEVLDIKNNYSVKDYLKTLLTLDLEAEVKQMVHDLIAYGTAAQYYTEYYDSGVIGNLIAYTPSEALPEESDKMILVGNEDATCKLLAAGVRYDVVNKVFVKIYSESDSFKLTVDGTEYTAEDCELVAENTYKLYLDPLTASELDRRYEIALVNGEAETVSTLEYGAYAYVKAVYDNDGASDAQKDLALALYRYGKSAAALAD